MFVSDNGEQKTIDAKRRLELRHTGGNSEGEHYFEISGSNIVIKFEAYIKNTQVIRDDMGFDVPRDANFVWYVHHIRCQGLDMPKTIGAIVSEALQSYKGAHGYPADQTVAVAISPEKFRI